MILIDPHNPNATKIHAQLSHLTDLSKFPLHVVFGGDGWMLQCIREYGHTVPFFGVNAGTLGFLLNSNAIESSDFSQRIYSECPGRIPLSVWKSL